MRILGFAIKADKGADTPKYKTKSHCLSKTRNCSECCHKEVESTLPERDPRQARLQGVQAYEARQPQEYYR